MSEQRPSDWDYEVVEQTNRAAARAEYADAVENLNHAAKMACGALQAAEDRRPGVKWLREMLYAAVLRYDAAYALYGAVQRVDAAAPPRAEGGSA